MTIAKAVIKQEVSSQEDIIKNIATKAIEYLPADNNNVNIKLNPADLDCIQIMINKNMLRHSEKIILTPDESIHRGGCIVSNEISSIDATCEKRLQAVLKQIGMEDKSSL